MVVKKLLDEFGEDIIRAFVQKRADYYLAEWKSMAENDSKVSWNWAGFLFVILWMIYRKMFIYSLILIIILGIILGFLLINVPYSIVDVVANLGPLIFFGLFGNYIYAYFVYNKLTKLKTIARDEDELRLLAIQKGGTSNLSVIIVLAIAIVLAIFINKN